VLTWSRARRETWGEARSKSRRSSFFSRYAGC